MSEGETIIIRSPAPQGHPLADTHEVACDLAGPTVEDDTLVWHIGNVRVELSKERA